MLLGNILWDTDFPKIGCKDTTNFAHTQEITTYFFKKKSFFFIMRQNKPIMLA